MKFLRNHLAFFVLNVVFLSIGLFFIGCCSNTGTVYPEYHSKKVGYIYRGGDWTTVWEVEIDGQVYYHSSMSLTPKITKLEAKEISNVLPEQD